MTRAAILAACAVLGACASPDGPSTDFAGNVYPIQCRGDLSYVKAPILFVPPSHLADYGAKHGMNAGTRLYGLTVMRSFILIDNTLRGWKRADAIRHERCHVIAGDWHKPPYFLSPRR